MATVEGIFREAYYRMSIVHDNKTEIFNALVKGISSAHNLDTFQTFGVFQEIANEIDVTNKNIRQNKVDLYNALVWAEYVQKRYNLPELTNFIISVSGRIAIMQPGYNRAANDMDTFLGNVKNENK